MAPPTRERTLLLLVSLPWVAAAVVMLAVTKLRDDQAKVHWALFGSGMICFSIGCLARTTKGLHDLAERRPPP